MIVRDRQASLWGATMWLRIKPSSHVPVYQQIVSGVKEAVAKGVLREGERLETVRDTAAEFGVNHNTVAKAYRELEREGVIETLGSKGTFIAMAHDVPNRNEKVAKLTGDINQLIVDAHHAQVAPAELKRMFVAAIDTWPDAATAKERVE